MTGSRKGRNSHASCGHEIHSHEKAPKPTKRDLGRHPFLWVSCPFVANPSCPSRAQGAMVSSRESPRSGVNVVGLRPSLIAQHSLRGSSCVLFTSARREGSFSAISAGRSPGKTPSLRGEEIHSHEKHKSARKSILALPIFVATPTRRRRPGHSSFLAFLASLAWDDFTQRAQSPRREVLGAALFCKRVLTAEGQRSTIQIFSSYAAVLNRLIS